MKKIYEPTIYIIIERDQKLSLKKVLNFSRVEVNDRASILLAVMKSKKIDGGKNLLLTEKKACNSF